MLERLKHFAKMIDWLAGGQLASVLVPGIGFVINGDVPKPLFNTLLILSVLLYVLLEALIIFVVLRKVDELSSGKGGRKRAPVNRATRRKRK